MLRILGIDPGTVIMGYGVVEGEGDEIVLVDCGALKSPARCPMGERLSYLYCKLSEIVSCYQPDAVAIELPFVAKNVKSALAVGKAQAVAILAAANKAIQIYEYTPTQVKHKVTDYGASSKAQVQEMVRLQLGLPELPQPDDVTDALAVAICHLREVHLDRLLASQK